MSERVSGKCKFYNQDKGYGFLLQDNGGEDIFIHVNDLRASKPSLDTLRSDQRVSFEIEPGRGGKPKAVQVQLGG